MEKIDNTNWNESRLSRRPFRGDRVWLQEYNNFLSRTLHKGKMRTLHPTKGYRVISLKRKGIFDA